MPTYVTREEFEARMGVLEGEVKGEKSVTRHVLGQTQHNVDDFGEVKSKLGAIESKLGTVEARLDHMAGDIVVIKADLGHHGRMLDVMAQDLRLIRAALESRTPPATSGQS
jgi:hypothetical protein